VRLKAAAALGQLRDPRSIRPLVAALDDFSGAVRHAAAGALKRLGKAAYRPVLEAYRNGDAIRRLLALGVLARSRSTATSELLIAAIDDPALPVRMEAARLLAQRKERRAVERLIAALEQPDLCVWLYAWALGEIGDPRAFEPIEALLESSDFHVRSAAVKALRTIDNARAVDLLHERLEDPSCDNRMELARTLANMDLLDAIHAVYRKAARGNAEILIRAAEYFNAAQNQLRSHTWAASAKDDTPDPDQNDAEQARIELLRQLESELRALARRTEDT
jgi:HEAT repeat protein